MIALTPASTLGTLTTFTSLVFNPKFARFALAWREIPALPV
jgi:hypothetical protein